jgi:hypothetical protein
MRASVAIGGRLLDRRGAGRDSGQAAAPQPPASMAVSVNPLLTAAFSTEHPMAGNKTKPTGASVEEYIAARASEQQRADCRELMALLRRITGKPARMWGPSIVGFGSYRYTYESGHSGEAPLAGFAIRGRELVAYVAAEGAAQKALLARIGRHRMGKSCLYFKRLADLDRRVLEQLVVGSIAEVTRRHG